jgi:cytochrome o ubiquinol oxidase subunit II
MSRGRGGRYPARVAFTSIDGIRVRRLRPLALLAALASLAACHAVVLAPSGEIAERQRDLLVEATLLMLIVIVPVMALTIVFAWRYRQSNSQARYEPEWEHSMPIELIVWAAPLLIIICLGALTWVGTHLLDPYRPLGSPSSAASAASRASGHAGSRGAQSLEVDVVALDWKWLFIYPQYGIATVNELAAPIDRPIDFRITSASVMNSFYIPALAGQIYAMAGMQTRLHAVADEVGRYEGFSANYSGAGFSGMRFVFLAMTPAGFSRWLATVRGAGATLSRAAYLELARPSENEPVHRYAAVSRGLYRSILELCVEPGQRCMGAMSARHASSRAGARPTGERLASMEH